jgi:hypothetical protein
MSSYTSLFPKAKMFLRTCKNVVDVNKCKTAYVGDINIRLCACTSISHLFLRILLCVLLSTFPKPAAQVSSGMLAANDKRLSTATLMSAVYLSFVQKSSRHNKTPTAEFVKVCYVQ